jgi:nitrite reductase/ring-hydroxylating ferredoxin subunit
MIASVRRLHRRIWGPIPVKIAAPFFEGCVRDGYLECPWHGYQFDPRSGLGPPGFSDRVPTYPLVTVEGITYLRA